MDRKTIEEGAKKETKIRDYFKMPRTSYCEFQKQPKQS